MRSYHVRIGSKVLVVTLLQKSHSQISFETGGIVYQVAVEPLNQIPAALSTLPLPVLPLKPLPAAGLSDSFTRKTGDGAVTSASVVQAPMPGTIIAVLVKEGDAVSVGQPLLVIEAMKMENSITAQRNGIVQKILIVAGAAVKAQQTLIEYA